MVDIRVTDGREAEPDFEALWDRLRSTRPVESAWVGLSRHYELLDAFGPDPATTLLYGWLASDLREISWL